VPPSPLLALSYTPGLGPRKLKVLLESFGSAEALAAASAKALREVEGVGPKLAQALVAFRAEGERKAAEERARAERLGVQLLTLDDPRYPANLRGIYDPPPVLYVRGTLPAPLQGEPAGVRAVAVVGTRRASDFALQFSREVARELAQAGVTVVSGLALGVDTAAHEGALEAPRGTTVAVLGSSVDRPYPAQNAGLARRITEGGGAVVSEYRLGTPPRAEHFPARNRLISGLARGVLVVEGGATSGALITAEFALEEGRTVFAVPGRARDPRAAGPLELLKQGAVLTQSADDVLSELGWGQGPPAPAKERAPELSGLPLELLAAIRQAGEPLLDDLVTATGKGAPELLGALVTLELQGFIRNLPSGRYAAV
jgi:DNA processing protein